MLAVIVISLLPGQARLTTLVVLSLVMMLLMMCLLLFMLLVRKVLLNYFHWRKTYAGYVLSFVTLLIGAVVLLSFRYDKFDFLDSVKFSENSNACDTSYMLGFSLLLGCLQLTGSAQLLAFFCWVNYQPFYVEIASFSFLGATLVLPGLQLNISCISWVLTSFFHLTTFYWMFLEGNFHQSYLLSIFLQRQDSGWQKFVQQKVRIKTNQIVTNHLKW